MKKRADGLYAQQITIEENGVKKRKSFYGKTKAEVTQKMMQYKSETTRGRTFEDVAWEFRDWHEKNSAYKTWECYSAPFKRLLNAFSQNAINSIPPKQINEFVAAIAKQGYSKRTVSAHTTLLNMIFDYAILHGYAETNPAEYVKIPKGLKTNHRELPDEKIIDIVKTNLDHPFGLLPFFILYTGCRRGEALAIRYEDLNRTDSQITISKSLYFENNKPKIKTPKTDSGVRKVPFLNPLKKAIPKKSKGYLFEKDGEPITQSSFTKRWRRYCLDTGLAEINEEGKTEYHLSLHQLRHAYATILYEAGIDEKLAQEILGHASIVTTRNIYTHIRESKIQEATDRLNEIL